MKRLNIRADETVQQYQARIKEALLSKIESINNLADACDVLNVDKKKYGEALDHISDKLDEAKKEAQDLIDDLG